MNVKVFNTQGQEIETLKLKDSVFKVEYNEPLIHQVVVAYLANQRQGTKSTLTRSEVRGHAKKPWRQKHTGRARHGSSKGPQWRGGGVVFAPKPRDYSKKVNKSMKIAAFKSAISTKFADKQVVVLDKLEIANGKTKEVATILNNLKLDNYTLLCDVTTNDLVFRGCRNIHTCAITNAKLLNVYDIVRYDNLVITADALKALEEVYA